MKALYFSHDYSARNDERVLELRAEYGWEGYGLFFGLVEMMAENGGCLNSTKTGALAIGLAIDKAKLDKFIAKCIEVGLFYTEHGLLRSNRLDAHLNKREAMAEAGRRGGQKSKRPPTKKENKPPLSDAYQEDKPPLENASSIKEKKEKKETKESKEIILRFTQPSQQQVMDFFLDKNSNEWQAARYYDYYTANGWMVGKNRMKDWQAAARNWIRKSNEPITNGSTTKTRQSSNDAVGTWNP